jgi:tRNA(Arg) A34 adenosine deaminase TadA
MKYRTISLLLVAIAVVGCNTSKKMNQNNYSLDSSTLSDGNNIENSKAELTEKDLKYLKQCLILAEDALMAGDEPFGSILVNQRDEVIATARNRVNEINVLAHPEIELAKWAAENLSEEERKNTTMYTSGEHCPMCATAHGWVKIGGLVYLHSSHQLGEWLKEFGVKEAPITFIPVEDLIKDADIKGPAKGDLLEDIKQLHKRYHQRK